MINNKKKVIACALLTYIIASTSNVYGHSNNIENGNKINDLNDLFTVREEYDEFNVNDYKIPTSYINEDKEIVYNSPKRYILNYTYFGFPICQKPYVDSSETRILK